jgi:hypothetical protein
MLKKFFVLRTPLQELAQEVVWFEVFKLKVEHVLPFL